MIKIISINYQERSEQAVAKPQSAFKNMPDVIQLDCLNDAINGLLLMRHELRKKMYPENKEVPYILEYDAKTDTNTMKDL